MSGPFKMKGWSPFTKKIGKGPIMPKDHPVTPPTKEESEKSKGTLSTSWWQNVLSYSDRHKAHLAKRYAHLKTKKK